MSPFHLFLLHYFVRGAETGRLRLQSAVTTNYCNFYSVSARTLSRAAPVLRVRHPRSISNFLQEFVRTSTV
jgi:hypothetical protein